MDKTIPAKNGSIRLTDDFIVITTDKPLQSSYDNINHLEYNRPGLFRRGCLEIGLKNEGKSFLLIVGYTDIDVYEKIGTKLSEMSNIPLEYSKYKLGNGNTLSEHEKTSDLWLLWNKFLQPIVFGLVFFAMMYALYYIIKIFG